MSEFRLTFGDVSKNQSISPGEMKIDWNKSKFKGKVQESIFNLFDSVTKDDKIDTRFEKSNMFRELKAAAGKDGDVSNLSEDEALSFLKEHNIEGATAQDLFDFFNIALDRPTEQKPEEQKVQEEPVQKPEEEAVQKPPVQEPPVQEEVVQEPPAQKPPVQEEVVQEPPAEVVTEQEAPAPQVKEETHNYYENSPNPNLGILNKNPQNEFFNREKIYQANTDLTTGNDKIAYNSAAMTYERRSHSYGLHEAQKLIEPQGATSLSVGAHTQYAGQDGMFNGVSVAGQVGIGENNRLSGAGSYTAKTGDNSSAVLNAQITDQQHFDFGGELSASVSYENYQNGQFNTTKEGVSLTGKVPIPGSEKEVLLGGSVEVTGQFTHSETNLYGDSNIQGSSNLGMGTVRASYNVGLGKNLNDALFRDENGNGDIPYLTLSTQVSAFNLSDTDGTHLAGGAQGGMMGATIIPMGHFGSIPIGGGFQLDTGAAFSNIPIVTNSEAVRVTGDVSYAATNYFKFGENTEQYLGAGVNTHISSINADVRGQYTLQHVAGSPVVHDASLSYSQDLNIGQSTQSRITAEGGYNSEIGAYGGVGVSFNIGNHKKK